MLLPISDDDRHLLKPALVTWVILGLNLILFAAQLYDPAITHAFSVVPWEISTGKDLVEPITLSIAGTTDTIDIAHAPGPSPLFLTLLTSMFLHAGFMHLGGNMLFLWIFGDNVEHRFGSTKFLIFYLVSGLAGAGAQILLDPQSPIPMLGASGAIAGILGAYIVLFPRNKVKALVLYWLVSLPAFVVIGLWIVMQIVGGVGSVTGGGSGGVAYAAHIGGLVAGVLLAFAYRFLIHGREPDSAFAKFYREDARSKRLW